QIPLHACSMSALISSEGCWLEDLQPNGPPSDYASYDDPWDYFAFVMDNSTSYSNDDGYGVVSYRTGVSVLSENDIWYKRVYASEDFGHVYYTGHYPDQGYFHYSWEPDTLDMAMRELMNRERGTNIILCHARNASRRNLGNHPFLFYHEGKTYAFMHNGFCDVARAAMVSRINAMNPGESWFSDHPSDHFAETDPDKWVDSEILFHYIMIHVIANGGNTLAGLRAALAGIAGYLENFRTGVFNFVMSDGEKLYVFRNTPQYGSNAHYKLSYKMVRDQFCGIRTGVPGIGHVELNPLELVVFSHAVKPRHYPDFIYQLLDIGSPHSVGSATRQEPPGLDQLPGVIIGPNPFWLNTTLSVKVPSASVVRFSIFNIRCELVWEKVMEFNGPATASVVWNASDKGGKKVSAGVYLLQVSVGGKFYRSRIVLLS
ncbi:MAG: class II glutamine amidotransferase, partial [Candidatus Syntrophosphaera sp.]